MAGLVPVNPAERQVAAELQTRAQQVASLAIGELRKADQVRGIANQLLEVMRQEMTDYRDGSEAWSDLSDGLSHLARAERVIRGRGETNGR